MRKRAKGVTLVELATTLAVASISLGLAAPTFQQIVVTNKTSAAVNEYVGTLTLARAEAIKRNARVTMCKSTNSSACTNSGSWGQGWIAFVDADQDAQADSGEEVLRAYAGKLNGLTISGSGDVANYVSYSMSGRTQTTSGAAQNGTVTFCNGDSTDGVGKKVVISRTGRARLERNPC